MNEVICIYDIIREKQIRKAVRFFNGGDDVNWRDKFQYFVTAQLSKSKQQIAEEHIRHFRNRLDREIYGKHRRLYKATFIEGGTEYNERHCHMLIQKPKDMTKAKFEKIYNTLWQEICGSDDIVWRRITEKDGGVVGLLSYLNKQVEHGIRAFTEELSDNSYQQKNRQTTIQILRQKNRKGL